MEGRRITSSSLDVCLKEPSVGSEQIEERLVVRRGVGVVNGETIELEGGRSGAARDMSV